MTVSSDNPKVTKVGNSEATVFSFDFAIFADADLKVVHTDAGKLETALTQGVDYSVSVPSYPGNGSITYPISGIPLPSSEKLTLYRELTAEQQTDLNKQKAYYPDTLEAALDRIVMLVQQSLESISRAIKVPISDNSGADYTLPTPEAGRALGVWNAAGNAIEIGPTASDIVDAQGYASDAQLAKADAETAKTNAEIAAGNAETAEVTAENWGRGVFGVNEQTSAGYVLVLTDAGKLVKMNNASAQTLTVPPNSSTAFAVNEQIVGGQYGAGQVIIVPGSGVTLRAAGGRLKTYEQYSQFTLTKIGTDEWWVAGDLAS